MHSGSHKTDAGFREILAIHAGINRGPSTAVKTHFPDLKPALLPSYSLTLSSLNKFREQRNYLDDELQVTLLYIVTLGSTLILMG
jgi:hypothetical protein